MTRSELITAMSPFMARIDVAETAEELVAIYDEALAEFGQATMVAHAIEDRAHDGTIFADAFDTLCYR